MGFCLFFLETSSRTRGHNLKLHQERSKLDIGKIFSPKGCLGVGMICQGGGEVTNPGSIQETTGHGILGYDSWEVVVLGQRLDLMILEIISSLRDSLKNAN